ncbi:MAG TPA: response regulator transcription factor [Methylomirabilota bacterium]|jgi:DNA-binding NarL/FixJ family response regulator
MSLQAVPPLERRIRILVVGGHEVVRLGLRSVLERSRWFEVVADVATMAEAVAATVHHPTLVLVAGPVSNGADVDGGQELRARVPGARIVVLGEQPEAPTTIVAGLGAVGCLSRQLDAQSLCRALREIAADGRPVMGEVPAPWRSRRDASRRDVLALTAQERRVLQLVAHGKTNKEIGTALGLSAKTVKNYLSNAFVKLNVSRRAQAAVLFIKRYDGAASRTRRSVG